MFLNDRISNREKYEAHRVVVGDQAAARINGSASPGSTTDTIILGPERPQENRLNDPVAEAGVEERVNGESCDRHGTVSTYALSSSCNYRRCVMLVIRTGVMVCEQTDTLK